MRKVSETPPRPLCLTSHSGFQAKSSEDAAVGEEGSAAPEQPPAPEPPAPEPPPPEAPAPEPTAPEPLAPEAPAPEATAPSSPPPASQERPEGDKEAAVRPEEHPVRIHVTLGPDPSEQILLVEVPEKQEEKEKKEEETEEKEEGEEARKEKEEE